MTHAYIHVESAGRKHAARPAIVAAATRPATARVEVVEQVVSAPAAYYVEERVQVAEPRTTTHFTFVEQVVQPRTVSIQQSANAIGVFEQEARVYVPRIEVAAPRVAVAEVAVAVPARRHRRRETVLVEEIVAAPRKQVIEVAPRTQYVEDVIAVAPRTQYVEEVVAIDSRRERRAARLARELAAFDAEVDFVAPTELAVLEAAARRQRRAARHARETAVLVDTEVDFVAPARTSRLLEEVVAVESAAAARREARRQRRAAQAAAVADAIAIDEFATSAHVFPEVTEIDVVAPRRYL
ncbi:hypothetical protein AMAG_12875 [Allomyces macrogynus ATCC 38327]|uniref:Uncharacterized protein n=1 Tax=Allomyces macrogynus (strain ATCC 38327) TaxID=578462 RepID=A0A0L0T098_ALLM3|nr:hypothetical protein AMAG_12875 [Allomyces macrogynus ATCC 38327]|eukprot:KNE68196.1 hypothetical protein AMAG_12875 [Allomyces macrogynus ATCC 38327]